MTTTLDIQWRLTLLGYNPGPLAGIPIPKPPKPSSSFSGHAGWGATL